MTGRCSRLFRRSRAKFLMSVDPSEAGSSRGSHLRLSLLLLLLIGGAVLVYWQRLSLREEQAHREAEVQKRAQAAKLPLPPVGPYGEPDFLGEPPFDLNAPADPLLEAALAKARQQRPAVEILRRKTAQEASASKFYIPVKPTAAFETQSENLYRQYRMRELSAYEAGTQDGGTAKEAGVAFLTGYLKARLGDRDAPAILEVQDLAQAALDSGSRDPMIRSYATYSLRNRLDNPSVSDSVWLECAKELRSTNYPRIVTVFTRSFLLQSAEIYDSFATRERSDPAAVAIVRWLEEESRQAQWRDCTWKQLDLLCQSHSPLGEKVLLGCLQCPQVDPLFVHMLAAKRLYRIAWTARGTSFAADIKPDAWERFQRLSREAADHFEYAWLLAPDLPYAATEMISVANAASEIDDSPRHWFLRAVDARLDHYEAYSKYEFSLTSRWGGSIEELLEFGYACAETELFRTSVPYQFLEVLLTIKKWEGDDGTPLTSLVPLPKLLQEFLARRDAFLREHPDVVLFGRSGYYHTRLAALLDEAEMPDVAAAELREAPDILDYSFLQTNGRLGVYELRRLQAAQGSLRKRVLEFDRELRRPWGLARTAVEAGELAAELKAIRQSTSDASADAYFHHAEAIVGQLTAFAGGGWADLSFNQEASGWEVSALGWHTLPETNELRMIRRSTDLYQSWARPLATFHPPFEIEFAIEAADPPRYPSDYGLQWHGPTLYSEGTVVRGKGLVVFRINGPWGGATRRMDFVRFPIDERRYQAEERLATSAASHARVKVWSRSYESVVGDAWAVVHFDEPLDDSGSLMFGEIDPISRAGGELRLSGVRIRPLAGQAPPEPDETRDVRRAFWLERTEQDSQDLVAAAQLAEILLEEGDAQAALRVSAAIRSVSPTFAGVDGLHGRALTQLRRYSEAEKYLEAASEIHENWLAMAAQTEIYCAGPAELRKSGHYVDSLVDVMKSGVLQHGAQILAAIAVKLAAEGDFASARDRNREAIQLASEPWKTELEARQKLYEADQPYELPPAADAPE